MFTFQALLSDLSKPTVTKDFEWQHKIFKYSILLDFVGHKLKYCIFQIKFYFHYNSRHFFWILWGGGEHEYISISQMSQMMVSKTEIFIYSGGRTEH